MNPRRFARSRASSSRTTTRPSSSNRAGNSPDSIQRRIVVRLVGQPRCRNHPAISRVVPSSIGSGSDAAGNGSTRSTTIADNDATSPAIISTHGIDSSSGTWPPSHDARADIRRDAGGRPTSGHDSTSRPHQKPSVFSPSRMKSATSITSGGFDFRRAGGLPAFSPEDACLGKSRSSTRSALTDNQ